jgi:hypothetical protein
VAGSVCPWRGAVPPSAVRDRRACTHGSGHLSPRSTNASRRKASPIYAAFLSSDHPIDTTHYGFAGIGEFPCKKQLSFSVRTGSSHFVHSLELQDVLRIYDGRAAAALTPVSVGDAPVDPSSKG